MAAVRAEPSEDAADEVAYVRFAGEFDIGNADVIPTEIGTAAGMPGVKLVVADLSEVTSCSPVAAEALVSAADVLEYLGVGLLLDPLSDVVDQMLASLGVRDRFRPTPDACR